ncbi:hypothetical protein COV16_05365 [Candidatus Woesearchaeota archaeon CG10_big_fil_rev_8_21_14_0_10_34_8]|nr:MAG: hypothetical protein COV16_05365 [Candidatus Woesearchaeota archaeon CG10_big_fil_rev_8_21_14_0_10_34_8]
MSNKCSPTIIPTSDEDSSTLADLLDENKVRRKSGEVMSPSIIVLCRSFDSENIPLDDFLERLPVKEIGVMGAGKPHPPYFDVAYVPQGKKRSEYEKIARRLTTAGEKGREFNLRDFYATDHQSVEDKLAAEKPGNPDSKIYTRIYNPTIRACNQGFAKEFEDMTRQLYQRISVIMADLGEKTNQVSLRAGLIVTSRAQLEMIQLMYIAKLLDKGDWHDFEPGRSERPPLAFVPLVRDQLLLGYHIKIKQSGLAYYPVQRVAYAPKEQ